MVQDPAEVHERIRIGGIKLSPDLAQFSYVRTTTEPCFLAPAMAAIGERHINIIYLSLVCTKDTTSLNFCVAAEHQADVESILLQYVADPSRLHCNRSAGTLTLFPHRNSLHLLGRVLTACGCHTLPVSGLLSSISALTFLTAYPSLDDTAQALSSMVELPANHTPLHPQSILVNMVETVAVYWEPIIRVYGFDVLPGTALLEATFPIAEKKFWGQHLMNIGTTGPGFQMALGEVIDSEYFRCCLTLPPQAILQYRKQLEDFAKTGYTVTIREIQPVDMLFFHGPHFQDRYGIAAALFRCLDQQNLSLHLVGCTGTSIYMVVGDGEAELVRNMLAQEFIVP